MFRRDSKAVIGLQNKPLELLINVFGSVLESRQLRKLLKQNEKRLQADKQYIDEQRKRAVSLFRTERRYNIIYMDPPWQYTTSSMRGGTAAHYETLSIDAMMKLPIAGLASEDCALLMWVVWPMLEHALELLHNWGFRYSTNYLSWIKLTKNGNLHTGTGNYTRANTEILILGIRGQIAKYIQKTSFVNVLFAPRQRHSQKPAEVKRMVELMWGKLPRIEIFSRQFTLGWDCWGNQAPSPPKDLEHLHDLLRKEQDRLSKLAYNTVRGPPGELSRKLCSTPSKSKVYSQKLEGISTPDCLLFNTDTDQKNDLCVLQSHTPVQNKRVKRM